MYSKISAIGHYLPETLLTNSELSNTFNVSEERIFQVSGIKERRIGQEMTNADLVSKAIISLFDKFKIDPDSIDCLILGTVTPDFFFPSTSVSVINKLKLKNAWAFDISAACSGFCYGLHIADSMIKSGQSQRILVCGSEKMSSTLKNYEYNTSILFGDGCGVALIEKTSKDQSSILNSKCDVIADHLEDVYLNTPFTRDWSNSNFELKGSSVYRNGVNYTIDSIKQFLSHHQLSLDDFDFIIPHQANSRIITSIALGLECSTSKFLTNIEFVGNTAAASIPICLSQKFEEGLIKKGMRLLLTSFGAGYTISNVDLIWSL
ncbi:MAG: ketoacyl-ACP synthase III [Spirosomataceae bacterium]|jgi:3-oxoacyl-[acyl-carrier-protein] synthase-3